MTTVLEVSSDWLRLREAEDAHARSARLAAAVPALLPEGPVTVHDLGSGTGSMMRWLAPALPGPQTWVLHDWNAQLTALASRAEPPLDRAGRPVAVRSVVGELETLTTADLSGASLVTASALLDVLTAREAHAIVDACVAAGAPALLSLSVTGDVEVRPWNAADIRVARAFNAHQRREVGGRRLLGPYGGRIVRGLFELAGYRVRTALTTWRLDAGRPGLLAEWFDGWLGAAEEQVPALRGELAGYRSLRERQLRRGELSAVVYHLDLLAWPR
ncbi:SAM-dependent methyltransferase [uncultured Leifsonia sp.]|uniref:SAM-dependent methyltransferase n=1 Tax=uncultured Leifsonia sp. TaxID=340359 RepID=UPI0028D643CB|nr:SAM-dependent methyltransferase [uncultured Leifsonia sp.]